MVDILNMPRWRPDSKGARRPWSRQAFRMKRSITWATPSSSLRPVVCWASALMSSVALPMATPARRTRSCGDRCPHPHRDDLGGIQPQVLGQGGDAGPLVALFVHELEEVGALRTTV